MAGLNGLFGFGSAKETVQVETALDGAYDPVDDMMKIKTSQKKWRGCFSDATGIDPAKWELVAQETGTSYAVSGGVLQVTMGTTANSAFEILSKEMFTIPMRVLIGFKLSQRIIQQGFWIELVSVDPDSGVPDGKNSVGWYIDGTTATQARMFSSYGGLERWLSTVATVTTTANMVLFDLETYVDQIWWHSRVMDANAARSTAAVRDQQVPDQNGFYKLRLRAENTQYQPILNVTNNGGLIRCNVTAHGFATSNSVTIAGVKGVTNANGTWTITVIDANNFDLQGSTFAGAFYNGGNTIPGVAAHGSVKRNSIAPATSTVWEIQTVFVNDYSELTTEVTAGRGSTAPGQSMSVAVTSMPTTTVNGTVTATAAGQAAHDAAVSGAPVRIAGRAANTNYATVATGDVADLLTTLVGALIVKQFAIPELDWSYSTATGGITDTADDVMKAAVAGNRNYITSMQVQNVHATVATEFVVKEGSNVLWRCRLPADMPSMMNIVFPSPLRSAVNTALNAACLTTGSKVFVNAQGYIAP